MIFSNSQYSSGNYRPQLQSDHMMKDPYAAMKDPYIARKEPYNTRGDPYLNRKGPYSRNDPYGPMIDLHHQSLYSPLNMTKTRPRPMMYPQVRGLTGTIKFDTEGFRTDFQLEILEVDSKEGLKNASYIYCFFICYNIVNKIFKYFFFKHSSLNKQLFSFQINIINF